MGKMSTQQIKAVITPAIASLSYYLPHYLATETLEIDIPEADIAREYLKNMPSTSTIDELANIRRQIAQVKIAVEARA